MFLLYLYLEIVLSLKVVLLYGDRERRVEVKIKWGLNLKDERHPTKILNSGF